MTEPSALLELTGRDRELLTALYRLRILSTPQVATLTFPTWKAAANRLAELRGRGLLDRARRHGTGGRSSPGYWFLTLEGLRCAEELLGVAGQRRRRPAETRYLFLHLDELMLLNDAAVALARLPECTWLTPPDSTRRFFSFLADGDTAVAFDAAVGTPRGRFLIRHDRPLWPPSRWREEFLLWRELTFEAKEREDLVLPCSNPRREQLAALLPERLQVAFPPPGELAAWLAGPPP
ncbi:MAG: replication-relaxation family protein [Thermaerobacter sp.]|nr:replication-relaxation family protein [Thermaerobacter sp.]